MRNHKVKINVMKRHQITDTKYEAALATGRAQADVEIRAQNFRYVPDRDAIELITKVGIGFLVPRQWIGALQGVPTKDLTKMKLRPDGSAIELEDHDIHISVHGLLTAVLSAMLSSRTIADIFARHGG